MRTVFTSATILTHGATSEFQDNVRDERNA
jgi:hypothetical protein